jgi:hypothetical protein
MYKYYILAFISGIIWKLYDDLVDNDLYEYFNLQKYKEYLNEFLKSLFIITVVLLSTNCTFFYIFFVLINWVGFFVKRDEYKAYETMVLLSLTILIPFLNFNIKENNITFVSLFSLFSLFICIFISECFTINIEYSYKKLITRSSILIILILLLLLFINNFIFLSKNIIMLFVFIIGSLLTSCIFQYILISRDKNLIKDNKVIKEEKEEELENKVVKEEKEEELENKVVKEEIDNITNNKL